MMNSQCVARNPLHRIAKRCYEALTQCSSLSMNLVALLAVLVAGYGLYLASGATQSPEAGRVDASGRRPPADVNTMVDQLAQRLTDEPDNAAGWAMLARSQAALGRFAQAASACRHAVKLANSDADLMTDCADIVVMSGSGRHSNETRDLLRRALAVAPEHPKALALAGAEAMRSGDTEGARAFWKRALSRLPRESPLARSVASWLTQLDARTPFGARSTSGSRGAAG